MKRYVSISAVILAAFVVIALAGGSSALEANDCPTACNRYVQCVATAFGREPSASEREQLFGGCMAACRRHQERVLQCYNQSQNQCSAFHTCIQQSARE
ncbi:MAG: Cys-rich protein [Spirochaetales bacterium]|nr:Cys-rich protein [Spirochaetales bacterium]MCP5485265.1 Cys-rich protein [Spirochaetales bacterium]